jgi:DNA-binding response OmpR family regulator
MDITRVLIVDDNTSLAESLAEFLEDEGFDAKMAGSGAEALSAWRRAPADLVVVDVDLPDIQGLKVARRLVRRSQGCSVVVMSARSADDVLPVCRELGAQFLPKPFSPRRLLAAIRRLAKERAAPSSDASRSRRPHLLLEVRSPRALLQWRNVRRP